MSTVPCGCDTTSKPNRTYCERHSFDSPESSNVSHAHYDVDTNNLTVTFQGKRTYIYQGVPPAIFDDFKCSESKGSYFQQIIKDTWVGVRVA